LRAIAELVGHPEEGSGMRVLISLTAALITVSAAHAQDPVKVDPRHYKVETENDQVRVLRITYGPGEKSVMHHHPASVVVLLTDVHGRFTTPNQKPQQIELKAGTVSFDSGGKHLPENVGDEPFEVILVELKAKPPSGK
jgi:quercetin dioxygenase-like cupin family protein